MVAKRWSADCSDGGELLAHLLAHGGEFALGRDGACGGRACLVARLEAQVADREHVATASSRPARAIRERVAAALGGRRWKRGRVPPRPEGITLSPHVRDGGHASVGPG
jgi:hypothetical protein